MTPPTPFEKALDEALIYSAKHTGAWDERMSERVRIGNIKNLLLDIPSFKQALLAAHRAEQKQLIIRIAREATERTPGETWEDWAWRVAKILKDELAALTPPETKP